MEKRALSWLLVILLCLSLLPSAALAAAGQSLAGAQGKGLAELPLLPAPEAPAEVVEEVAAEAAEVPLEAAPAAAADGETTGVALSEENFPDANFRQYLSANVDSSADGFLSPEEIAAVTEIVLMDMEMMVPVGVSDLTGLSLFTNLEHLNCASNGLTSLDVSANTALKQLDCRNNQLTSLDVSALTALERLECSYNGLTALDVSRNTALSYLLCGGNELSALDLSANTALYELTAYENALTALDVSANTALRQLDVSDNALTALDVSANTRLQRLSCGENLLTALDVSANTELENLNCSSNGLTALDVSRNTALDYLNCGHNILTELDVSANTLLRGLRCESNGLTVLDVSQNTAIDELICSNNALTSLDVSALTADLWLEASGNRSDIISREFWLDLSTMPGGFELSKASEWTGGTVEGTILSMEPWVETVSYSYDCGQGKSVVFSLGVAPIPPHVHEDITFQPWDLIHVMPTEAGNYYLTANVNLSDTWNVPVGETRICLNGFDIIQNGGSSTTIEVPEGASLSLYECAEESGCITHAEGVAGTGVVVYGDLTMNGGVITGNTREMDAAGLRVFGRAVMNGGQICNNDGGGVYVAEVYSGDGNGHSTRYVGEFTMNGGQISGNTAMRGGGVCVKSAVFTMNGGRIESNIATQWGGGVSGNMTMTGGEIVGNRAEGVSQTGHTPAYGGGGVHGNVTMSGGSIRNNYAAESGGGVCGSLTMSGGEITGNTALYQGGGVSVSGPYTGYGVQLSGVCVIENNSLTAGRASNLYLPSGDSWENVSFAGEGLRPGSRIGIGRVMDTAVGAGGQFGPVTAVCELITKDYLDYFTSDWVGGFIAVVDQQIYVGDINKQDDVRVFFRANGEQLKWLTLKYGEDVELPAIPFEGAYAEGYDRDSHWDHDGQNIVEDTVITAVYVKNRYTVTWMANGQPMGQEQTVEHGQTAVPPAEPIPQREGYTENAPYWPEGLYQSIRDDICIQAVYLKDDVQTLEPPKGLPEDGGDYELVMKEGEVDVSQDMSARPDRNEPAKIEQALEDKMKEIFPQNWVGTEPPAGAGFRMFELELRVSRGEGEDWRKADEDCFPEAGITVYLPYPPGVDPAHVRFAAVHMFSQTSDILGTMAGDMEVLQVQETPRGLRVTLKGLSPVAISWIEEESVLGDADSNGRLNARDATVLLRYDAGVLEADDLYETLVDVDGNGVVNARDATLILRKDAGVITQFPVEE